MSNDIKVGLYRVVNIAGCKCLIVDSVGMEFEIYREDDYLNIDDVIYFKGEVASVLHDGSDIHATIFSTNKCNSNCIMCPDTELFRKQDSCTSIKNVFEFIDILPSSIKTFDITGGEPTLLKEDLILIIGKVYQRFSEAEVMIISNGRAFADYLYSSSLKEFVQKFFKVEIPIHSSYYKLHDYIVGVGGSFDQTISGIRNLCIIGVDVRIRIVISKLNINDLKNIVQFVVREFPQIAYINFMGMEVMGNAFKNKSEVWIEFDKVKNKLEEAIEYSIINGINVQLYNFPLCMFDKRFWTFYRQSITPSKIKYKENCELCSIKDFCGGFFNSTIVHTSFSVNPLLKNEK